MPVAKWLKTQKHSGKKDNQKGREMKSDPAAWFTYRHQLPFCWSLCHERHKHSFLNEFCVCCLCDTNYSEYYFHYSFRCVASSSHILLYGFMFFVCCERVQNVMYKTILDSVVSAELSTPTEQSLENPFVFLAMCD